jgi:DNA-binding winged helix-turn-helix (wHTH) protein
MRDGWTIQRMMIVVAMVTILVTAVAVILFSLVYRSVLTETFDERSVAYAMAFADSTNAWLAMGDEEMMETAARFLLLGSVLYVQVVSDEEFLVDARVQAAAPLDLPLLSPSLVRQTIVRERLAGGPRYLDLVIPSGLWGTRRDMASKYVRMGIDTTSIGVRLQGMVLIASGIGIAFDALLLGIIFLFTRRARGVKTRSALSPDQRLHNEPPRVIQVGGLCIDEAAKKVSLTGREVRLTPKQYTLLALLASDVGRVFSEAEILKVVWSESDYADSKDVKQYIYLLRRRLAEANAEGATLIVNVPGFGYKLEIPLVEQDLTDR